MNNAQTGLFGVYTIWYQPWWHTHVFWWSVFCVVFLITILSYVLYRRYFCVKKLTPEQFALQQLHRLKAQSFVSDKIVHDSYFNLTMIAKQYLEGQFHVVLKDKTDIQVAAELDGILPKNMISLLQEFFDRSFRIKFAYDAACESMLLQDIHMLETLIIEMGKLASISEKS